MVYAPSAVRASGAIDRWKRRALTAHRKPPPGVDVPNRREAIAILLERDGQNCACGCGKPVDIDTPNAMQIDHKIPLHRVAHLPDAERAWYHTIDNMGMYRTRPCHQKKSAREMKEKAHLERAAERHQRHQDNMARKGEVEE